MGVNPSRQSESQTSLTPFIFHLVFLHSHTSDLSFFLHTQNFVFHFSPHRKCINSDKIGFATKQRKSSESQTSLTPFIFHLVFLHSHTSDLSFFLHTQNFVFHFSPHRKCINSDKIGFATKQRKSSESQNSLTPFIFHLVFLHSLSLSQLFI